MPEQLELAVGKPTRLPPNIDPDAAFLFYRLRGMEWVHRSDLQRILGGAWPLRRIREAAHNSQGYIVSGPGSPGYCRVDECHFDRAIGVANAVKAQRDRMTTRYTDLNCQIGAHAKRRDHACSKWRRTR